MRWYDPLLAVAVIATLISGHLFLSPPVRPSMWVLVRTWHADPQAIVAVQGVESAAADPDMRVAAGR